MARTHSSEAPGRTCQLRQLASRTEGGTVLPPPRHRGDDDVTRGEVCSLEPPEGGEPRRAGCAEQQREQAQHADKPTPDDRIEQKRGHLCAVGGELTDRQTDRETRADRPLRISPLPPPSEKLRRRE